MYCSSLGRRMLAADREADGDRRVEVPTGDVTEGGDHQEQAEAEPDRPGRAGGDAREADEEEAERADDLGREPLAERRGFHGAPFPFVCRTPVNSGLPDRVPCEIDAARAPIVLHYRAWTPAEAERIARDLFGVAGTATPLAGERDRNFRLDTTATRYVLKLHAPRHRPQRARLPGPRDQPCRHAAARRPHHEDRRAVRAPAELGRWHAVGRGRAVGARAAARAGPHRRPRRPGARARRPPVQAPDAPLEHARGAAADRVDAVGLRRGRAAPLPRAAAALERRCRGR